MEFDTGKSGIQCPITVFSAEEGEIAILAHTSNAIGTPGDLLASALQDRFGGEGAGGGGRPVPEASQPDPPGV